MQKKNFIKVVQGIETISKKHHLSACYQTVVWFMRSIYTWAIKLMYQPFKNAHFTKNAVKAEICCFHFGSNRHLLTHTM